MERLKNGTKIHNYEIIDLIGQSQLGITYLATLTRYNPVTGEPTVEKFSIKAVNLDKVSDPNHLQQEVKKLENISKKPQASKFMSLYHSSFVVDNVMYIISEFLEGTSLQEIMINTLDSNPDYNRILKTMNEISESLEFIHRYKLTHQNIKPSNIYRDSKDDRFKLIDFSESCSKDLNAKCKGKPGTVYYMPPEVINGTSKTFNDREKHDVWSTGVTFYQLANNGEDFMNFASNEPEIIAKDIQLFPVKKSKNNYHPINGIIEVMLNKNVNERPTSSEVNSLIYLARPGCKVDGRVYTRAESESVLFSLGINVNSEIDDKELCEILTDNIKKCHIKGTNFIKSELVQFAHNIGIEVDENMNINNICEIIKLKLQTNPKEYTKNITENIIKAIEYKSLIDHNDPVYPELRDKLNDTYAEAQRTELIDIPLLKNTQTQIYSKYLSYKTQDEVFSKSLARQNNEIINMILQEDETAEIDGVSISKFVIII